MEKKYQIFISSTYKDGITAKFLTMKSGISYSPHNLVLQIVLLVAFYHYYVLLLCTLLP